MCLMARHWCCCALLEKVCTAQALCTWPASQGLAWVTAPSTWVQQPPPNPQRLSPPPLLANKQQGTATCILWIMLVYSTTAGAMAPSFRP